MDSLSVPFNLRRSYFDSLCMRYEQQQKQMYRQREEDISRLEDLLLLSRGHQQKRLQLLQDHSMCLYTRKKENDICKTGRFLLNGVEVSCSLSSSSQKKKRQHEVEIKDNWGEDAGEERWWRRKRQETVSLSEEDEEASSLQRTEDGDILPKLLQEEEELRGQERKTMRRENRRKDSVVHKKMKSTAMGETYSNESKRKEKKKKRKSSERSDHDRVPDDSGRDDKGLEEEEVDEVDEKSVCRRILQTQGVGEDNKKYQDMERKEEKRREEEGVGRVKEGKEERGIPFSEEDEESSVMDQRHQDMYDHSCSSSSPCSFSSSSCCMMIRSSESVFSKLDNSGVRSQVARSSRSEQERYSFPHQRTVFRSSLPLEAQPLRLPVEKTGDRKESGKKKKKEKENRSRLPHRHELCIACSSFSSASAKTSMQTISRNLSTASLRKRRKREEEKREEEEGNHGEETEEEDSEKKIVTYRSPSSFILQKKPLCCQENDEERERRSVLQTSQASRLSRRRREREDSTESSSLVEARSKRIDYRRSTSSSNRSRTRKTRESHSHEEARREEKEFRHQRNPVELSMDLMKSYLEVFTPPSPCTVAQSASSSSFYPTPSSFFQCETLTERSRPADQRETSCFEASSRTPWAAGRRILPRSHRQVKGEKEQEIEQEEEKGDSFGLWCVPPEFFGCRDLGGIREAFQKFEEEVEDLSSCVSLSSLLRLNEEERKAFFLNIAQLLRRHSALHRTHLHLPSLSSLSSSCVHPPHPSSSPSISSLSSSSSCFSSYPASSSRVVHEKEDQEICLQQEKNRNVASPDADGLDIQTHPSSLLPCSSSYSFSSSFSSSLRLALTTSTEGEEAEKVVEETPVSRKNETSQISSSSSSLRNFSSSFSLLFFLLFCSFFLFFSSLSSFFLSLIFTKLRRIYLSSGHPSFTKRKDNSSFPSPAPNKVADKPHTSIRLPASEAPSISKKDKKDNYSSSLSILHDGKKTEERKRNRDRGVSLPRVEEEAGETYLRGRERKRRGEREERKRIKDRRKTHEDLREIRSLSSSCEESDDEEEDGGNDGVGGLKNVDHKRGMNNIKKKKDLSLSRGIHDTHDRYTMLRFLSLMLSRRGLLLPFPCSLICIFFLFLKLFKTIYHIFSLSYLTALSLFHSLRSCLFPLNRPQKEETKGWKEKEGDEETASYQSRYDVEEAKEEATITKKQKCDSQKERRKESQQRSDRWLTSRPTLTEPGRTSHGARQLLNNKRQIQGCDAEEEEDETNEEEERWCSMKEEKKFALDPQSSLLPSALRASSSSSLPPFFSVAISESSFCAPSSPSYGDLENSSRPTYRIAGKDVSVKYIRDVLFHLGEKQEKAPVSYHPQKKENKKNEKHGYQSLIGRKEEKRRRERQKESDIYHESREAEEEDSGRFRRNRFRQQEDTPGRRIQTDSCLSGVCTPEEDDQHQASSSTSAVPSSSSLSSSSFSSSTSYSSVLLRSSPSSSSSLLLIPPPRLSGVGDEMPRSFPFERRETEKETSLEKVKIVFNPMLMKAVVYISQLCSYVSFCRTKQALDFFFSFISHFILTLRVLLGRKRKNEKEEGQGKTMKTMKKNEREGHHGDGRTGSKEEVARKRQKTEVQEKEDTEGEESSRRQRGGGGEEEWEVSILLKFIDLVWRKSIALQVTDSRVLCFLHDRAPFFPLVIFHPSTCDHQLSVVTEKILDHSVSISLSESSSSCKISLPLYFLNSPHFTASLPAFSSSSFSPSVRRKASFFQRRDDSKEKILKAANKILCTKRQKTSISPFAHKRWRGDSHDSEYSQFRGESESCFSSTPSPSSASMCRHTGTEDEEEEESRTKKRRPTETSKEKTTGRGHLKRENSSEGVLKRRREREGVDTLGRKSAVTLLPLFRRGLLGLHGHYTVGRRKEEEIGQRSLSQFIDHQHPRASASSSSSFSDRKSSASYLRNGEKFPCGSSLPSVSRKRERREKRRAKEREEGGREEGVWCVNLERESRAREREEEEERREVGQTNDRIKRSLIRPRKKKESLLYGCHEEEEEDSFVLSSLLGWLARHHTRAFKTSSTAHFSLSRTLQRKAISVGDEEKEERRRRTNRSERGKGRPVRIGWCFYRDEALIQ